VRGCKRWQTIGLKPPERVLEATRRYRKEVDHIRRFLQECAISDQNSQTPSNRLYESYERWCTDNGERGVSMRALARRLVEAGYSPVRNSRSRGWQGLSLRGE
jgi:putative DNA primase/helicase